MATSNGAAHRRTVVWRRARRGSVYVAVLGVAMISSMIGLAALHIERVNVRAAAGRSAILEAQIAANSAIELALASINADANWRSTFVYGADVPDGSWTSLGSSAKCKFSLRDVDGSLLDNVSDVNDGNDSVTLRGTGSAGGATCVTTVLLEPRNRGLNCLDVSLHSAGQLTVDNNITLDTNQTVSSNTSIYIQVVVDLLGIRLGGSWIDGNAWSTGSITDNGVKNGTVWRNQSPPREMPDPAAVFDYYKNVGTRIPISSIPSRELRRVVLSANSNPYGQTNPQGIYVIDCAGQQLTIRDARIRATVVLINASSTPRIVGTINWEPAAANYPALMVQGNLYMNWDGGSQLSESSHSVTFNPPGTPYLGSADLDTGDNYPGIIKGLVYVTGNLTADRSTVHEGIVLVGGSAAFYASSNLTYNAAARDFPPPGFTAGAGMRVVPGTWRRTVSN
jgi:hypothetical protein